MYKDNHFMYICQINAIAKKNSQLSVSLYLVINYVVIFYLRYSLILQLLVIQQIQSYLKIQLN